MNKSPKPYLPTTVDEAVYNILDDLTLQDKISMDNMDKGQMRLFEGLLAEFIGRKIEAWSVNQSLMADCVKRAGDTPLGWPAAASTAILRKLWEKPRKPHKLRVVKWQKKPS